MRGALHSFVSEHDHDAAHQIWRISDPASGVIVAGVAPNMRRLYELGQDLLISLGKDLMVTGSGRDADLDWDLLPVWLLAHRIRHVVIMNAEWLPPKFIEDLAGLAAVTGIDLWLVAHDPVPESYFRTLDQWPVSTDPAALVRLVRAAPRAQKAVGAVSFPRVPNDNFPTFLAEARRHLDPDDFAVVDARFRAAFTAADLWFVQASVVDEESVLSLARAALYECASTYESLVVVRGTQVAAFRRGWLVKVDIVRLLVTADAVSRAAIHSPATWQRLSAYREPYRAAACALAACDLSIAEILTVTCGGVDPDGSIVTYHLDGSLQQVTVPVGAEVFLRAQRIYREHEGATPDEALFSADGELMNDRFLGIALRAPILEVGVPLLSQRALRTRMDSRRWANRWGLSVQALA
jgi:hypothetical protein